MTPANNDPLHRKLTKNDLPDILVGIALAVVLFGFLLLKYLFPYNSIVMKYTTGVWGVVNGFLLIALLGCIGLIYEKWKKNLVIKKQSKK